MMLHRCCRPPSRYSYCTVFVRVLVRVPAVQYSYSYCSIIIHQAISCGHKPSISPASRAGRQASRPGAGQGQAGRASRRGRAAQARGRPGRRAAGHELGTSELSVRSSSAALFSFEYCTVLVRVSYESRPRYRWPRAPPRPHR